MFKTATQANYLACPKKIIKPLIQKNLQRIVIQTVDQWFDVTKEQIKAANLMLVTIHTSQSTSRKQNCNQNTVSIF